ncbi:MAG TPA: aldo/keto reductase [Longimicrobiaceae bacterium]|nr:aldo/keto reductase [Longimicrobiaceae bacterium]
MQTRRIGSLEVSVVGLGCNNFGSRVDAAGTTAIVDAALEAGINFLDTADIYGRGLSEEYMAPAVARRRGEIVLATKFGMFAGEQRVDARPEHVRNALDASLRRLGPDYVDLYQLHRPDSSVPIAETLGALDDAVKAGKVREIGCSNFSADQLREAETAARPGGARFVSVQNEYSLVHREPEDGVLAECERLGIGFIPYFPLASGLLTGKYRRGQPRPQGTRLGEQRYSPLLSDQNLEMVERLADFAEARGRTILELAFSWLLSRPAVVSVIAGATKAEQVRSNAHAAGWEMTADELAEVDRLITPG